MNKVFLSTEGEASYIHPQVVKPILKYPGAKWSRARWIISHFPKHQIYLEPYCGSAAVFFCKEPADHEILGDSDGNIINLFQVLRTRGSELAEAVALTPWAEAEYEVCKKQYAGTGDALEDARRFLVRCWQAHGPLLGKASNTWRHRGIRGHAVTTSLWKQVPERLLAAAIRLCDAEIRCRPALELIAYYNHSECLIYCDPPYIKSTRRADGHYRYEMTEEEHRELLSALDVHQGSVVLSGYAHPLYDACLQGWHKEVMMTMTEHGQNRQEVLWLNPRAIWQQQLSLFAEDILEEDSNV